MNLRDLVEKNRSIRRFDARVPISEETLRDLVETVRYIPSAANRQPLKYVLSCSPDFNGLIFHTLSWAAYLKDWEGPEESEQPSAYVIVTLDKSITFDADVDAGIAAQTILLAAVEKGFGGCILANFKRAELEKTLGLPADLTALLVIALGMPVEKVVVEDLPPGGSNKYYRDENRVHHVPKRMVGELIFAVHAPHVGAS